MSRLDFSARGIVYIMTLLVRRSFRAHTVLYFPTNHSSSTLSLPLTSFSDLLPISHPIPILSAWRLAGLRRDRVCVIRARAQNTRGRIPAIYRIHRRGGRSTSTIPIYTITSLSERSRLDFGFRDNHSFDGGVTVMGVSNTAQRVRTGGHLDLDHDVDGGRSKESLRSHLRLLCSRCWTSGTTHLFMITSCRGASSGEFGLGHAGR